MSRAAVLVLAGLAGMGLAAGAALAQAPSRGIEGLAREILAEMVAEQTTVQGNTTPLAERLAARFRAGGFADDEVMVLGAGPRDRNFVARIKGRDRSAKPILFLAHLDVVGVEREAWTTDPWVLTEKEGWLYGRGVLDDKGPAAALAAAFLVQRRLRMLPARDLILALTAGEEHGERNGVEWLIANRRDLVDAEYVVNLDAGGGELDGEKKVAFAVQAAEKVYLDVGLRASGPGGHSSMPIPPSPIDRLAAAITRLTYHEFPVNVNPVVRAYFSQRGAISGGAAGNAFRALGVDPTDSVAARALTPDPVTNALIRTTCLATLLSGGIAPNAIPSHATANINCRLIPGESGDSVIATLRRVIADSTIELVVTSPAKPSAASILPASLERAMRETVSETWGPMPLLTFMETGATDGLFLRNAGIPVFGAIGLFAPEASVRSYHANDERVPVRDYDQLVRFTRALLGRIAVAP